MMSTLHALIIDDQRSNVEVLAMLLAEEGFTFSAVDSPGRVTATLSQMSHIDVVFLDLEFPNADGLKLIQELRLDPRLQGVPIVAYTVHTSQINEAKEAGFDGFLGKPLDARQFPDQLKRILNHESVWSI